MRELDTDRPHIADTPHTVDAGHFQVESGLVNLNLHFLTPREDLVEMVATNLKAGLSNDADLQLLLVPWVSRRSGQGVATGQGDLVLRLKRNLWGNDGGSTAGGLISFLRAPTGSHGVSDGTWEAGLLFPVAASLALGWHLEAMAGFWMEAGETLGKPGWSSVQAANVEHEISQEVSSYVEVAFFEVEHSSEHEISAVLGTGFLCRIGSDLQLDLAVNLGLGKLVPTVAPTIGLSYRY
jgi:hypothetical protein